eukprot:GHRR01015152.1.p1 GENE.GHRR01015152.1~~GHRR01015152.1.p1  ORF type:complete len:537 (+),score=115.29 GHRR01015152.1:959-2569(+)
MFNGRILLQGALPATIPQGAFSQVQYITIDSTGISGALPQWLFMLPLVNTIEFIGTSLLSTLPELPRNCSTNSALRSILFVDNPGITGSLPSSSWARCLPQLTYVEISNSSLTGPLPSGWSQLHGLIKIGLSSNMMTGQIPSSWASLKYMQELDLSSMNLSGSIPPAWHNLEVPTQLQKVNLSGNSQLTGCMPDLWTPAYGVLQSLDTSGTGLMSCLQQLPRISYNVTQPGWSLPNCSVEGYTLRPWQLPAELPTPWDLLNSSTLQQDAYEARLQLYSIHQVADHIPLPHRNLSATKAACDAVADCVMFTTDGFLIGSYVEAANGTVSQAVVQYNIQQGLVQWQYMPYCSGTCCGTYVLHNFAQAIRLAYSSSSNGSGNSTHSTSSSSASNSSSSGLIAVPQDAIAQPGITADFPGYQANMRRSAIVQCAEMIRGTPLRLGYYNCPQRCKVGCCWLIQQYARKQPTADSIPMSKWYFDQCSAGSCSKCGFDLYMSYLAYAAGFAQQYRQLYIRRAKGPVGQPSRPRQSCKNGATLC